MIPEDVDSSTRSGSGSGRTTCAALDGAGEDVDSATLDPPSPWVGGTVATWRLRLANGRSHGFRIRFTDEFENKPASG